MTYPASTDHDEGHERRRDRAEDGQVDRSRQRSREDPHDDPGCRQRDRDRGNGLKEAEDRPPAARRRLDRADVGDRAIDGVLETSSDRRLRRVSRRGPAGSAPGRPGSVLTWPPGWTRSPARVRRVRASAGGIGSGRRQQSRGLTCGRRTTSRARAVPRHVNVPTPASRPRPGAGGPEGRRRGAPLRRRSDCGVACRVVEEWLAGRSGQIAGRGCERPTGRQDRRRDARSDDALGVRARRQPRAKVGGSRFGRGAGRRGRSASDSKAASRSRWTRSESSARQAVGLVHKHDLPSEPWPP